MVSLLHPCSYLAAVIAFLFVTLSLGGWCSRAAREEGRGAAYSIKRARRMHAMLKDADVLTFC